MRPGMGRGLLTQCKIVSFLEANGVEDFTNETNEAVRRVGCSHDGV